MIIDGYEFDNEWTMRRDSVSPYPWILRDHKGKVVDRDQYRHDLFGRHGLTINGRRP